MCFLNARYFALDYPKGKPQVRQRRPLDGNTTTHTLDVIRLSAVTIMRLRVATYGTGELRNPSRLMPESARALERVSGLHVPGFPV